MILEGHHKFGFLIGELYRPPSVISRNDSGKRRILSFGPVNQLYGAIDWQPLLYAAIAKDIWDTTQKLYLKPNASHLYKPRKQIHECKKRTMDVTSYFNKLSLIWQEMDLCSEIVWNCFSDSHITL